MTDLTIAMSHDAVRWLFTVKGALDHEGAVVLASAVQAAVPKGAMFVLDLGGVDFIDSTGLGTLLRLKAHGPAGRSIELRNVSQAVLRLLEITGVAGLFTIT